MNRPGTTTDDADLRESDWLRPLRYLLRIPLLLLHLTISLPLTLLLIAVGARWQVSPGETLRQRSIRWWSGLMCRIFGLRLKVFGAAVPDPALFVANHVSWIDIEVLHSQRAVGFVAKAEIQRWPIIGWLATAGDTVYHARGSSDSLGRVIDAITRKLRSGHSVAIFPEGRTGSGERVLPFHGRLFSAAVEAECPIQPVAIRFSRHGRRNPDIPFGANEHFIGNLFRVMGEAASDAEVHFLSPIHPDGQGRREMARTAHAQVAEVAEA